MKAYSTEWRLELWDEFTPQQRKVYERYVQGQTQQQIAGDLGITTGRVGAYLSSAAARIPGPGTAHSKLGNYYGWHTQGGTLSTEGRDPAS